MATAAVPSYPGVRLRRVRPRWTPWVSLAARLCGPWLDRELAAGVEPWRSPLHSAHSLQITGPRARRSLARSVDGILTRAQCPAQPGALSSAVALDRRAVLAARPELTGLAARLREGRPVSTRGVAALRDLVADGTGPLYNPLGGEALARVLAGIRASLDIRD